MLEQGKWTNVQYVIASQTARGRWTFAAKPPHGHISTSLRICALDDTTVTIARWARGRPQYTEQKMKGFNRWLHAPTNDAKAREIPATILDPASQTNENSEMPDDASDGQQPVKRSKPATPTKADPAHSPAKPVSKKQKAKEKKGPNDTVIWDLHGQGDRAYRAMAAVLAARAGKSKEHIEENIATMAKSMKAKGISWLKEHTERCETWAFDPMTNAAMEDGNIPASPGEYLASLNRQGRWIDGRIAQAIAFATQNDIITWGKRENARWRMITRLQPEEGTLRDPIVLLLDDDHCVTLDPMTPAPEGWKKQQPKETSHVDQAKAARTNQRRLNRPAVG